MRKPIFGVSGQVRHKPVCTMIEDGYRLVVSDLESTGIVLSVAKAKALISCPVTMELICLFSNMQKTGFLMTQLMRISFRFWF